MRNLIPRLRDELEQCTRSLRCLSCHGGRRASREGKTVTEYTMPSKNSHLPWLVRADVIGWIYHAPYLCACEAPSRGTEMGRKVGASASTSPASLKTVELVWRRSRPGFSRRAGFLEHKRAEFPRFYFLSDTALLALLAEGRRADALEAHLPPIFPGIARSALRMSRHHLVHMGTPAPLDRPAREHRVRATRSARCLWCQVGLILHGFGMSCPLVYGVVHPRLTFCLASASPAHTAFP